MKTALILAAFLAGNATAREKAPAWKNSVDSMAAGEIEKKRAIGLVIGVAKDGKVLHLEGYGLANIELGVETTPDHAFRIGSITKTFTAVAILQLAEDGKLSLDDPLTKYLPDYPAPGDQVTIRHLLHHTSGIVSLTSLPDHRSQMHLERKQEEVIDRFKDKPFEFQPGARFKYNNSGYFLLGVIIEKASKQSYEDYLKDRIFNPLGLKSTFYARHARIIPHRASGYALWGEPTNAPYFSTSQPFAAGALVSTAGDLLKFGHGLASGKLLKPETHRKMVTRGKLKNGNEIPYGYGCFIGKAGGRPVIRHGGGIPGFASEFAHYPDSGITIAVLANANQVNVKRLAENVARFCHPETEN